MAVKAGLALAGGGPLGGIWEAGALLALDEALVGLSLAECDVYVGVSAGSIFAAGLANGMTPRALLDGLVAAHERDPFDPAVLTRPALREFGARAGRLVPALHAALGAWMEAPEQRRVMAAVERLAPLLPTGIFDGEGIRRWMAGVLAADGRTDDFRALARRLFVVATDLDSGALAPFGAPGWDDVPISTAVTASCALPGLYPPVEHAGRFYVDGVLRKTLHASLALREGVELLFCLNPLVPFDSSLAAFGSGMHYPPLVEFGLPIVLSQTFRAIIHSRMQAAFGRYAVDYPRADLILLEPARDDAEMLFVNVFSYADRQRLAEHAYQRTRQELLRRAADLAPVLARHGLALDVAALEAPRTCVDAAPAPARLTGTLAALDATLERLRTALPEAVP